MAAANANMDLANVDPVIELMKTEQEAFTNGTWGYILSQVFPFPEYVIAPEYKPRPESRMDFSVMRVRDNKMVFAYEGKRAGTTAGDAFKKRAGFQKDAQQITKYLRDCKLPGTGGYSFGVLAAGPKYAVVQTNGASRGTQHRTGHITRGIATGGLTGLDRPNEITAAADIQAVVALLVNIKGWMEDPPKS